MNGWRRVRADQLSESFDGFLFDAYGVLVHSEGVLPGAAQFLAHLRAQGKPFRVVSNDASTTQEAKVARWAQWGLELEPSELLTPWQVLASPLAPLDLSGVPCFLIGTPLSQRMLRSVGARLADAEEPIGALVIADERDESLWEKLDQGLSRAVAAWRQGGRPHLVLMNPDLVYPSARGFGLTAGSLALMIEAALQRLLAEPLSFVPIGKPQPYLFQLGLRSLGLPPGRVVMIGDQWETDILGSRGVGLAAALVGTGVTPLSKAPPVTDSGVFLLDDLRR